MIVQLISKLSSLSDGLVTIRNREASIIRNFYRNTTEPTDSEAALSREKKRIVKTAIDILKEEIRTFEKYSSKLDEYPTLTGYNVDSLLEGN